ncbi:hypothetical protein CGCSCA5_v000385 [Colletotrichum siamense]|nr:hypothetical protein CGCSCA5_v000385 [Colletotrichum siamense]
MSADNLEQSSSQAKRSLNDDGENTNFPLAKRQRTANTSLEGGWLGRTEGRRKLEHADYSVGWICALPIELAASQAMLDEIHQSLPMEAADTNIYTLGSIRGHNIAMTCLGKYGTNDAAAVANHVMRSFQSIRFGFMVGIGGGAPGETDVRLGDVVVGKHVTQHDLGKFTTGDGFQGIGTAKTPPPILQKAVAKLSALHEANGSGIPILLQEMQQRHPGMGAYAYPTAYEDRLFRATYTHDHPGDCAECSLSELHRRPQRDDNYPRIHYGGIASGNQVIKCSQKRDYLGKEHDAICFEMEAAGLSDTMPSIVIRGICDYADSHKNKEWQRYAAATAAAYAKELISVITPSAPRKTVGVGPSEVLEESPEVLQTRRNAFLELLRFEQIDSRHTTIKNAHSKTCEWLLQDPSYKQWLNASNSARPCGFFWISGKPGAGKSTLMKFVLSRARSSLGNNDAIISFFFNARGDTLEKSTTGLYRSLLLQLLESFPDLQSVLDDSPLISPKQKRCPAIEVLQDLFCDALKFLGERQVTCFIDALDECNEKQVQDMVVFFEGVTHDAGAEHEARLKICFSSRHYPHIYVRHGIKIVLEHQTGHKHDLEKYIQSYLRAEDDQQVEDIRLRLLEKASGVFMWVVLVVDLVNNVLSRGNWFAVDKLLHEIPSGLSELFKDILRREHDKVDQNQFLLCVQWLLFAKKPLSPQEFHYAVLSGLMEGPEHPLVHNPEKVSYKTIELFVNSSSKGLAEVTKSGKATVQFIHESGADCFENEELFPQTDFEIVGDLDQFDHALSWAIKKHRWTTAKLIINSDHFDWLQSLNPKGEPCIHSAAIAGDADFMVWLVEKQWAGLEKPSIIYRLELW